VAIGDKNPKDLAGRINELAANGRLVGSDFFAHRWVFHFQSLKSNSVTQ
jgi:hypothetical protein